jgi:CO/xanthine dehydrogenase FAD-binding subunit
MKPAPFDYVRPETLAEACALLADDEDARIIAGGQTLIPMLAMRLARPTRLVDILRLTELRGIRVEGDVLVIGAVTRQVEVERSEIAGRALPLLMKALPWVGHPPTRNRGHAWRRDRNRKSIRPLCDAGRGVFHRADADIGDPRRLRVCGAVSGLVT